MFGNFRQWLGNVKEYRELQKELTSAFSPYGINFMHLHPEITKLLVAWARAEDAETAVNRFNSLIEKVQNDYPHFTQEEVSHQLLRLANEINTR